MCSEVSLDEAVRLRSEIDLGEGGPIEVRVRKALPIFTEILKIFIQMAEELMEEKSFILPDDSEQTSDIRTKLMAVKEARVGAILAIAIAENLASRLDGNIESLWATQIALWALADVDCRPEWKCLIEAQLLERAGDIFSKENSRCVFDLPCERFIKDFDPDEWGE